MEERDQRERRGQRASERTAKETPYVTTQVRPLAFHATRSCAVPSLSIMRDRPGPVISWPHPR